MGIGDQLGREEPQEGKPLELKHSFPRKSFECDAFEKPRQSKERYYSSALDQIEKGYRLQDLQQFSQGLEEVLKRCRFE